LARHIHILSEQTIDQIAAGEVIENPASVVKELFENAVDAGATRIIVEILGGGFQSIRISDDGSGMSDEDAFLCLKRHATSKIRSSDDLIHLYTMGFRGEALASIAAISQLTLNTADQDGRGVEIEVKGGDVISTQPSARPRGTTIEVRSLFYNVPARKKFQKTATASSAEITRVTTLLALAHPHVGVELIQQRKTLFNLRSAAKETSLISLLQNRSAELLGSHFDSHMHSLYCEENGYEMHGLIGDPCLTRYNRSGQYLFVNARPVSCFPLAYAIRDGYGTRVDTSRHPIYVIHAKIDPTLIDVNVHPQKKDIRLREEEGLKVAMRTAVNRALQRSEEPPGFEIQIPSFTLQESENRNFDKEALQIKHDPSVSLVLTECSMSSSCEKQEQFSFVDQTKAVGVFEHYLIVEAQSLPQLISNQANRDGVFWIDLLAAQARILFERLMREQVHPEGPESPKGQGLLLPLTFSCSKAEAEKLLTCLNELKTLGFELRSIGPTVFMVETIPSAVEEREVRDILEALLSSLTDDFDIHSPLEKKIRKCAETICRVSRSRSRTFSLTEALKVFHALIQADDPLHCPQGKPIFYHLKKDQIDDYFHA